LKGELEKRTREQINTGSPISCSKEEYPEVRKLLHDIASSYADENDVVRMHIALSEVKRLDQKFGD
jgi:hypothetical protein